MTCPICSGEGKIIYEDTDIVAMLLSRAVKDAHISIAPKTHVQIISQVPDAVIGRMFVLAKKLASIYPMLSYDSFNLVANNRAEDSFHFALNLIPRSKGDGLNLDWERKTASPQGLEELFNLLKQMPISFEQKKSQEQKKEQITHEEESDEPSITQEFGNRGESGEKDTADEADIADDEDVKEDYMLKQFKRIP